MDNIQKCSMCNEILTAYGNKQLKDGVLCRNCVKLASSFLDDEDYKKRNVEDIKRHLKYREDNLKAIKSFKPNRIIEGKYSLYIDDDNKLFVISKRKDLKKENADVINIDDIYQIHIYEKQYLKQDNVDIYFEAKLDNPEIDKVLFRVNEFSGINILSDEYKQASELALRYLDGLMKDLDFKEEV